MMKKQEGTILLATLMLVLILTTLGMVSARKGKVNEQLTGSKARFTAAFEAAESTARRATEFMLDGRLKFKIGEAKVSAADLAKMQNFDKSKIDELVNDKTPFLWRSCSVTSDEHACMNYASLLLDDELWKNGVLSTFGDNVEKNNIRNNIQSYTIIEKLDGVPGFTTGASGQSAIDGSGGTGAIKPVDAFYLVSIKSSVYPPDTVKDKPVYIDSEEATENVFIQLIVKNKVNNKTL